MKFLTQATKDSKLVRSIQLLTALAYFGLGFIKLIGLQIEVDLFERIGFGQWFRYLAGFNEALGAILFMIPETVKWGGLLLASTAGGAIMTHIFLIGGSFIPALILMIAALYVSWIHYKDRHSKLH